MKSLQLVLKTIPAGVSGHAGKAPAIDAGAEKAVPAAS